MKKRAFINILFSGLIAFTLSGCQVTQAVKELIASSTPTATATATATFTPTVTATFTATATFTETATPTSTNTPLPTNTPKPAVSGASGSGASGAASGSGGSGGSAGSGTCAGADYGIESSILSYVNYQRTNAGLSALSASGALSNAARGHSQDMAVNNFFSHTGSSGSSPFDRMSAAGFSYSAAAENIYAATGSQNNAGSAVAAWMASPSHRDNILNGTYTYAGVGYWCSSSSEYEGYYTLDFARP